MNLTITYNARILLYYNIHFIYFFFLSEYQTQQLEVNLARHAGQHEQTHEIYNNNNK